MTATIPNLDWRTFHIAIGTIDTTITFERLQNDPAAFAVIEILAGVSRHNVFRYGQVSVELAITIGWSD